MNLCFDDFNIALFSLVIVLIFFNVWILKELKKIVKNSTNNQLNIQEYTTKEKYEAKKLLRPSRRS